MLFLLIDELLESFFFFKYSEVPATWFVCDNHLNGSVFGLLDTQVICQHGLKRMMLGGVFTVVMFCKSRSEIDYSSK